MDFRGRNKIDPNFNVASMTDIIFLLLIFFIITSVLVTPQHAISLILPKADGKVVRGGEITSISISKNNEYFLNETPIIGDSVESILQNKFEKVKPEERNLTIRAEQGVPIEAVVSIMNIANKNKYKTVLAIQPEK